MRIVLDIETNLKHNNIHCVVTQDIDTKEVKVWTEAKQLCEFLATATLIVGHNVIAFDAPLLNRLWKTSIRLKNVHDTLVLSRLLDPARMGGHSLESWGQTLGTQKIDYRAVWQWMKGRRENYDGECFDDPIPSLLVHYCIRDVEVCRRLYTHLCTELEAQGFSHECREIEHKVAAIISEQERNGFKLDTAKATMLLTDVKGRMAEVYEHMQQRWPSYELARISPKTGKPLKPLLVTFNPGSRKQIGEKLIELGWKPKKFTETGLPMVDEDTLREIKGIPEASMIADYLMYQKRVGQIEAWLEAIQKDGRVHGKVITNGAITGRATHSSPNMAQIPNTSSELGKECRECWTVEEGNVMVGVDLSGIELRCLAHYMQDAEWQHELLEGDAHWKNTQAFGLVPMGTVKTDSPEHKDARNLSKTLCYSVLYGAGPAKVGETAGVGPYKGKKLIENFFKNTPSLDKLATKVKKLSGKGYLPALDGRKIWIRSEHAALNSLLQSAGAIIAKQWLICLTEDLKRDKIPYKLLGWIHDEVQLETPAAYGDRVGEIVAKAATRAGEVLNFRCPVAAEYRIGENWYETH